LPSYVDDVIEGTYESSTSFKDTNDEAITGESGKIYVDTTSGKTYRWAGSTAGFVEISASLALGETASTAYPGDKGKIAYDYAMAPHAPVDAQANVIESIKMNGTAYTITNKSIDIGELLIECTEDDINGLFA